MQFFLQRLAASQLQILSVASLEQSPQGTVVSGMSLRTIDLNVKRTAVLADASVIMCAHPEIPVPQLQGTVVWMVSHGALDEWKMLHPGPAQAGIPRHGRFRIDPDGCKPPVAHPDPIACRRVAATAQNCMRS
jgi:hypothetical protein